MADEERTTNSGSDTESPKTPDSPETPDRTEATTALGEEAVLNAAVAFAGHVVTAAQQAAEQTGDTPGEALRRAVFRQHLLETATLCLRRLSESYGTAADDPAQAAVADLMQDGAARALEATATVEALGDLSLDILDRLLSQSASAE
ncbi:MAG: hypothetical protein ACRDI2_08560 [Chloroflexota bacterium]